MGYSAQELLERIYGNTVALEDELKRHKFQLENLTKQLKGIEKKIESMGYAIDRIDHKIP